MRLVLLAAAIAFAAPAIAQESPAPDCVDGKAPAAYAPWAAKATATSATGPADLAAATLEVGKAYDATLKSTKDISFPTQPEKPGGSVSSGGLFQFKIADKGNYTVALGSGAWIDVLKGGKALESNRHGHGPSCTTIRKMVTFPLEAGVYTLQISANAQPHLELMVLKQP